MCFWEKYVYVQAYMKLWIIVCWDDFVCMFELFVVNLSYSLNE